MVQVELTDDERKVLSYISRGVSKDTAAEKIGKFFSMSHNDVLGAISSLRKKNLVIESKGVASGVVVYATSPITVKSSMLDQQVVDMLKEGERGVRASGFKRKTFTTDPDTGEVLDEHKAKQREGRKGAADLGFDLEE
jgi:hypothetical protein